MRLSLPSLALGLLIGLPLWPVVVEQALAHLSAGDRLLLTDDLVLCQEGQAPCSGQEGGLLRGTVVQTDSKGFATVTFRVAPPLVAGRYEPVPTEKGKSILVLSKRTPVPPSGQ